LELRKHQEIHGTDATLGPYGPYRDWPLKAPTDAASDKVPATPIRDSTVEEGATKTLSLEKLLL
jgi:hypothetical protein